MGGSGDWDGREYHTMCEEAAAKGLRYSTRKVKGGTAGL